MGPQPIGILYEHPEWFKPLFAELDRRGLPYARIPAQELCFDPTARSSGYSVVVNRVSPSAYLRGHTSAIFAARDYLSWLEVVGTPLVNGPRAQASEVSKARQLATLAALGVPHPRSRVINSASQLLPAARQLTFPVIVKPNVGGSGALMTRFEAPEALALAADRGDLDAAFGLDGTAIVQEFHQPRGGSIVRVEFLDGALLYAIRIHTGDADPFNLCPADICQAADAGAGADGPAPLASGGKKPLRIEVAAPPEWLVGAGRRVFAHSGIDVGGLEYLESERDGQLYVYDVNALSNFVSDAPTLLGFDPFARFVDYLERRLGRGLPAAGVPSRELIGV